MIVGANSKVRRCVSVTRRRPVAKIISGYAYNSGVQLYAGARIRLASRVFSAGAQSLYTPAAKN